MKKNLLSVLILVLMIVNIAMSAVMMMSVISTNGKTAALMDSIGRAMNLELNEPGNDSAVSLADTETYDLGSMTIHLAYSQIVGEDGSVTTSDKQVYIVFDIAMLINTTHEDYEQYGGENISQYESMIKDAIEGVVSSYTEEECRAYFNDAIRDEILKSIQDLFHSEVVYGITLSNVKYG